VLYIVARSVDQGRAAGLVSALGVHAGTLVHIAAAAAGLSVLLAASATLFSLVKYLGAAYLIFLGVRRLLDKTPLGGPGQTRAIPWRRAFLDGAIVNVLNRRRRCSSWPSCRSSSIPPTVPSARRCWRSGSSS
jgi:threonine/homoserine/homoserine lactone efflux protein